MDETLEKKKKIIYVLDCGGQYCHLIASRIRRQEAYSAVVPCEIRTDELIDACGIIVSGGPQSVFEATSPRVDPRIYSLGVPVLGICYGCQMMCQDLGGVVVNSEHGEYGAAELDSNDMNGLIPQGKSTVWMSHRDVVTKLPETMETIATTEHSPHAAVRVIGKPIFGVQFHPEVKHTRIGETILGNFVDICQARGSWRAEDFLQLQIKDIADRVLDTNGSDTEASKSSPSKKKSKVTQKAVFMLVSGGVDSTVAFAMIAKALPAERLRGLYVDTGMMRQDESKTVQESLELAGLGARLSCVDASERFLNALKHATAPEEKRRIIGREFINVQRDECAKLMHETDTFEWLLGQGTIYPDTIESGGKPQASGRKADVIKTHHNRVPEIDALLEQGLVLEPLSELYKDEVRAVGEQLGLPHAMVWRQPFPGPGLGVRLLCCDSEDNHLLSASSMEALRSQAVSLLKQPKWHVEVPPLKSVGCQGDSRTYRHFAVLKNYTEDWDEIASAATRIVNGHDDLNRVVLSLSNTDFNGYSLTAGAPHTVTKTRLEVLRRADFLATNFLDENNCLKDIWQCPVVMAPIAPTQSVGSSTKEVIILRPVDSTEAMTAAFSRLPFSLLKKLAALILDELSDHLADVLFDVTNKPPGTIEWE